MEDLAIKNGLVVTPRGVIKGGLTVKVGRITQVGDDQSLPPAKQEIDAGGNFILPGAIDPHVHLGLASKEKFTSDCRTESISAAIGGTTTMITTCRYGNMQEARLHVLQEAKDIAKQNSFIDFKLTAYTVVEKHLEEIPALLNEGITTFKFLMGYKGSGAAQVGMTGINWGFVYRGLEIIARHAPLALASIHCEEPEIIDVLSTRLQAEGRQDLAAWAEARPGICEAIHILDVGHISQELGAPVYVVHVSAKESVDALRFLRGKGINIHGETCIHYLVETREAKAGILAKVNPPLRASEDRECLWQALTDGTFEAIGTDHLAYMRADKESGGLWGSMPGFGGIGAMLALLVSEGYNKGKVSIEQIARLTAENVARLFHIYPTKGALSPGSDADITIIDPDKEWVLGADTLNSISDFSVCEGRKVKGKVVKTFVRGKLVADHGKMVAKEPLGQYVYPCY